MRLFLTIMFGMFMGVVSKNIGINFLENPINYLLINIPAIICFAGIIKLIKE